MITDQASGSLEVMIWVKDANPRRMGYQSRASMTKRAKAFLDSPIRDFSDLHRMMAKMFQAYLAVAGPCEVAAANVVTLKA